MEKVYFSLVLESKMFPDNCNIQRRVLEPEEAKKIINKGVISCLDKSHPHFVMVGMMNLRYEIKVRVPKKLPEVLLNRWDSLLVLEVHGLPRLTGTRDRYRDDEIIQARLKFVLYAVVL